MSELQLSLHPIARIHGEPLLELPQGLYIPPDALELVLENFQGPLDFLLYLIRKHNPDLLRRQLKCEQMNQAAKQLNELRKAGRDFEIVQVLIERTVQERLPQVSV